MQMIFSNPNDSNKIMIIHRHLTENFFYRIVGVSISEMRVYVNKTNMIDYIKATLKNKLMKTLVLQTNYSLLSHSKLRV